MIPQKGLSLIETMVAITISLILLAGVAQIYLSSKQSFRIQNELATFQENQRIVLEILSKDIRKAGFSNGGMVVPIFDTANTTDGGSNNSDQIAISYESAVDCLGNATPAGVAVNRYFISNNQLVCRGKGACRYPHPRRRDSNQCRQDRHRRPHRRCRHGIPRGDRIRGRTWKKTVS